MSWKRTCSRTTTSASTCWRSRLNIDQKERQTSSLWTNVHWTPSASRQEAKAMVYDGVILPASFCHISEAESFYRSAHQYFHHISRKFEAYSEIAERLHESVFISDEEMYAAVCALCVKIYNMKNPTQLGVKERIEMARHMHQKYNASNRQIRNILKLDNSIVETMFP